MGKAIVAGALAGLLMIPTASGARLITEHREPEGCQAYNPGQPKCNYEVTHETDSPATGIVGVGTWVVKIKRGKEKITHKSPPSGEPTGIEVAFEEGDKVIAKAVSSGSAVTAGHID
ncbi:MAG: hypothetical protein ACRDKB_10535 [Actinomycetota bacterium]